MEKIAHFFDSNFFIAVVTLTVGLFAIYIYKKQQRDAKRSVANTVLLEIINADKQLKSAKIKIGKTRREGVTQIPEHHYLMPTESWSKYKSMLVKDFKEKQWNRLDKFYNDCQLFDETVAYNDSMFIKDTSEIRKNVHRGLYKYVSDYAVKIDEEKDEVKKAQFIEELKAKKEALSRTLTNADYIYTYLPSKPVRDIERLIDEIESGLSVDDVGQKLKTIASGHWWW